ncbi:MAG: SRPBCC family protein [Patulibacter sp.]|nr:SRPBCC family protein [Patulibacter sp.]
MDPVSASVVIQRPREEVFAYLADIANHPSFLDHRLVEWRLTREDSIGAGAGARVRARLLFNRFARYDVTFHEVEAPHRIGIVGRGGKYDRTRVQGEITVVQTNDGGSRVTFTLDTEPKLPSDQLMELVSGQRGVAQRALRKGMRRLQGILETADGVARASASRASIAGGARKPSSGFRLDGPSVSEAGSASHASNGPLH